MAFPNTPILDDFNRADENPIAGNWTNNALNEGANNQLKIVTNQLLAVTAATSCEAYWNKESFDGNIQIYATVITKPGNAQRFDFFIMKEPGTTNWDGYQLLCIDNTGASNDTFTLQRIDNSAVTVLATTSSIEYNANDVLGMSLNTDGKISVYQNGTQILTAVDRTYTGSFYLALGIRDTTGVLDDFGGGTVQYLNSSIPNSKFIKGN